MYALCSLAGHGKYTRIHSGELHDGRIMWVGEKQRKGENQVINERIFKDYNKT